MVNEQHYIKEESKMKYLNILLIIILTSCAGVADFVTRDVSLSYLNANNDVIIFQPQMMPDNLDGFELPENMYNLLFSYNPNDKLANTRYFNFKKENYKEINVYFEGYRRGGVFWIIPPLGLQADTSTTIIFTVNKSYYLFKSEWKEDDFNIYIINENRILNKLDENDYNELFTIKYYITQNERQEENVLMQKEVDNIIITIIK